MSLGTTPLGWRWLAACREPERYQRGLLGELLARHASTSFGREHSLSPRMSLADFSRAVPIRSYSGLQPWIDRAVHGEPRVLTAEHPYWFARSSGTTGTPKYLPITKEGVRAYQAVRDLWWHRTLLLEPQVERGTLLLLSSPPDEERLPGRSIALRQSVITWVPSKAVAALSTVMPDPNDAELPTEIRRKRILESALCHDVSMIVATSPSTVWVVLEDLANLGRDRRDVWPNLSLIACWTEGPSALYAEQLRRLSGGVRVRDIGLPASEGYFAVPVDRNGPSILAAGEYVIELVTAEESPGEPVPWRELEVGCEYRLVVTTPSGLWRYDTKDVVEVVGRLEQTPGVAFRRRAGAVVSIAGEKVTEQQVVQAVRVSALERGIRVSDFVCRLVWPARGAPRYRFTFALAEPSLPTESMAELLDRELCALNSEYRSRRAGGRLDPAEVRLADGALRDVRADAKLTHLALDLPTREGSPGIASRER